MDWTIRPLDYSLDHFIHTRKENRTNKSKTYLHHETIHEWFPMKTRKLNNFHSAGATYNRGVIFRSPLHQTNNKAVDVAAQDPPQHLVLLLEQSTFQH